MMPQHNAQVAKGMGWLLSASFVVRSLGILSMLILTRLLLPEDFGLVALATTLLQILSVVTEMQLTAALVQLPEVEDRHLHTSFTLAIVRALLVALAMIVGGFALASIYGDGRLIGLAALLALDPLAMGLRSPRFALFDKDLRFGFTATIEMAAKFTAFAVTVIIALVTRSYWAIAIGQVAGSMLIMVGSHLTAPYRPAYSLAFWRRILSFSAWLNLMGIVSTLSSRLDNFFVAGFLSKAILGQYVIGNQLAMLVSEVVLLPLQRALFPGFAKVADDPEARRAFYIRSQAGLVALGVPIGFAIALVARPAVYLFIGPSWTTTAQVIEFVAPIFGIQLVFGPVNAIAMAMGQTRALFLRSLWNLALRLPAILVGLNYAGITGLLIARCLSGGIFLWIADATLVAKLLDLPLSRQIATTHRSLISGVALVIIGLTLRTLVPIPSGTWNISGYIVLVGAASLAAYLIVHAALWIAAGRPRGVETDMAALTRRVSASLLRGKRPA